jgi:hypothetical protein
VVDGAQPVVVNAENYDSCWVDVLNALVRGTGVPVGNLGMFDPAINRFTDFIGATGSNQLIMHDKLNTRLLIYGGGQATPKQYPLPSGPLTTLQMTNSFARSKDYVKQTRARGGMFTNGRSGVFGDFNVLYEVEPNTLTFVPRTYTGVVPPEYTWFKPVSFLDAWLGWCNSNTAAGGVALVPVQKFYLMFRKDMVMLELPVVMPSIPVKGKSMAGNILVINEYDQCAHLLVDDEVNLFTLDLRGLL